MSTLTRLVIGVLAFIALCLSSCERGSTDKTEYQDTIVAGGKDRFLSARHVVIRGSNFEIGRRIAEIAKGYGVKPFPSPDTTRTKLRREYFARAYPILFERIKGVAAAFGVSVDDNKYDVLGVSQGYATPPGCSAVFYPPQFTENGHGILSRNYDFTTGTFRGTRPRQGEIAVMSRPHVVELYPDKGYASLAIHAFDILSGVLDGINSEGLTVSILADDESPDKVGWEPGYEVGFPELASMQYLLDNCKDVQEAKEALLSLKTFYTFIPCHYIIADRRGNSFIFEFSPQRNRSIITDGKGPLCVTNHLIAYHRSVDSLPAGNTYDRYKILYNATKGRTKFTLGEIEAINASVAVPPIVPKSPERAPSRTLWHALYDIERRSLKVKFYLGERPDPKDKSRTVLEYSDYVELSLKTE